MPNCQDPSVAPAADTLLAVDAIHEMDPTATATVLSIENVARMFNISQLTLRYFELRGLIKRRHRIGRVPVYGWADCDRIAFIIKCRKVGLVLGQVAPIVAAVDHEDDTIIHKRGQEACMRLVNALEERRKNLDEALAELAHTYTLLSEKILSPDFVRSCD